MNVPFARDSDTSQDAAKSMRKATATLRAEILQHIVAAGNDGLTCDEVEAAHGYSHQTASARINELRNNADIFDTGERRVTRSGRKAAVYRPIR